MTMQCRFIERSCGECLTKTEMSVLIYPTGKVIVKCPHCGYQKWTTLKRLGVKL